MELNGSLIISWDFTHGRDKDILLVGKQKNGVVEVINAFQGIEAFELWKKLAIRHVETN